jgi:hypothetical protein
MAVRAAAAIAVDWTLSPGLCLRLNHRNPRLQALGHVCRNHEKKNFATTQSNPELKMPNPIKLHTQNPFD